LQRFPCELTGQTPLEDWIVLCEIQHGQGHIQSVTVIVNMRDGLIHELTFQVRELYLGDLVLCWGHPYSVEPYRKGMMLRWSNGARGFINLNGRPNYRTRLVSVSLGKQTQRTGTGDGLRAVGGIQLAQDLIHIPLDRTLAEDEVIGDLTVQ
jgi:hypothetical protein